MAKQQQPLRVEYAQGVSRFPRNDLAALIVQIIGIYCLLEAIPFLSYFSMMSGGSGRSWQMLWALVPGFYLAAGVLLLIFAARLAPILLASSSVEGQLPGNVSAGSSLQPIAFSVVGVYLVASALPGVVMALAAWGVGANKQSIPWLGDSLAQLTIGIGLFLGARGLSRLWHNLRHGGVKYRDEADK